MSVKPATLVPAAETKERKKTKEDSKEVQVAKISSSTTIQVTRTQVICTLLASVLAFAGAIIVNPNKPTHSTSTLTTNRLLIDNKADRAKDFIEKNNQEAQNAQKALLPKEHSLEYKKTTIEVLNTYVTQNEELKEEFIKEKSRFDQAALTDNVAAIDSSKQRMNQLAIKDAANLLEAINKLKQTIKETEKGLDEVQKLLNRNPVTELAELLPIQLKTDPEQIAKLHTYPFNQRTKPDLSAPYGLPYSNVPSIWPMEGNIGADFGLRRNPFDGISTGFHKGQDLSAPMGTPVISTANGVVICAGWQRGYGQVVYVDHGNGLTTRYGHLSKINVTEGQIIKRGQQLGNVGSTGRSTSPHLHYEVRINGQAMDPSDLLPNVPVPVASIAPSQTLAKLNGPDSIYSSVEHTLPLDTEPTLTNNSSVPSALKSTPTYK